jgi:hypothetical protein
MSSEESGVPRTDRSLVPDTVPRWKGRPVPWVAQWTGETFRAPHPGVHYHRTPDDNWRLAYRDSADTDWWAPPGDHRPVLWRRTRTDRSGTPQYALLNAVRQRTALVEHLCQVCGQSAAAAGGVAWLMHRIEWEHITAAMGGVAPGRWRSLHTGKGHRALPTANPPTCMSCWRLAAMCPSIRKYGAVALTVGVVRPIGVTGDVYPMDQGIPESRRVDFGEPDMDRMMARLLVAELDDVQVWPDLTGPSAAP